MKDRIFVGRVLFRREGLLVEVLNRYRSWRVLIFMMALLTAGCVVAIALSRIAVLLPGTLEQASVYLTLVGGLAILFLVFAFVVMIGERGTTVITDRGILYGGMFQRWAEIRCCAMRKTRRGLVVWIQTRRRLRLYFRERDSEVVEKLIRYFCSEEVLSPDCRSG